MSFLNCGPQKRTYELVEPTPRVPLDCQKFSNNDSVMHSTAESVLKSPTRHSVDFAPSRQRNARPVLARDSLHMIMDILGSESESPSLTDSTIFCNLPIHALRTPLSQIGQEAATAAASKHLSITVDIKPSNHSSPQNMGSPTSLVSPMSFGDIEIDFYAVNKNPNVIISNKFASPIIQTRSPFDDSSPQSIQSESAEDESSPSDKKSNHVSQSSHISHYPIIPPPPSTSPFLKAPTLVVDTTRFKTMPEVIPMVKLTDFQKPTKDMKVYERTASRVPTPKK